MQLSTGANRLSVGSSRFRPYIECADLYTFMQLCAVVLLSKLLSRYQGSQLPGESLPDGLIV
jgi:hypothetical protein